MIQLQGRSWNRYSNSEKGKTLEHYFKLAIRQDNEIITNQLDDKSEEIVLNQKKNYRQLY